MKVILDYLSDWRRAVQNSWHCISEKRKVGQIFVQVWPKHLEAARDLKEHYPDLGIQDIETSESRDQLKSICECTGTLQFEIGQWATAWLVNRTSLGTFYKSYIPDIVELGGRDSFETYFGLTIAEFYGEFEEFTGFTSKGQLAILSTN